MLLNKKLVNFLLTVLGLFSAEIQAQSSIYLKAGTRMHGKGTLLAFHGLNFMNEGEFSQDSSTVLFSVPSTGKDLRLGGRGNFSFEHLHIKMEEQSLMLDTSIRVAQNLVLESGQLDLNRQTVFLGKDGGQILGEGKNGYITGQGIIEKRALLNFPSQASPGNIGLEISVEDNLGLSVLRRIQEVVVGDSLGLIHRQYEFESAFESHNPVTLTLHYLDSENPFGMESNLVPVEQHEDTWSLMEYYKADKLHKRMQLLLPSSQKSWHIGLSPSVHQKRNIGQNPPLDFEVFPNPFDQFLLLQWESVEEKPILAQLYLSSGALIYEKAIELNIPEIFLGEIPELAAGIYFLKILTDKGRVFSRSVVRRAN